MSEMLFLFLKNLMFPQFPFHFMYKLNRDAISYSEGFNISQISFHFPTLCPTYD